MILAIQRRLNAEDNTHQPPADDKTSKELTVRSHARAVGRAAHRSLVPLPRRVIRIHNAFRRIRVGVPSFA